MKTKLTWVKSEKKQARKGRNLLAAAITPLIGLIGVQEAFAADVVDLRNSDVMPASITSFSSIESILGLQQDNSLTVISTSTDIVGNAHTRYQQRYKGVPVWGHQVIVTKNASGRVVGFHGDLVNDVVQDVISVKPKLSAAAASQSAMSLNMPAAALPVAQVERNSTQLSIYIDDNGIAKLAYVTSYFTDNGPGGKPTRPLTITDANTGATLVNIDILAYREAQGPGGNIKGGKYEYGVDFPSLNVDANCQMQNVNVKTIDMKNSKNGGSVHQFTCPRNTVREVNGAYSPLNDAHFFGSAIVAMYQQYYGVKALKDQLEMRVHYDKDYENAFWNGRSMTFGDGKDVFHPLVTLDVAGHEVSHGFTEQHSNLIYSNQSGGINEAFSDMAGEVTEYFVRGSNDWAMGNEVFKKPGALRYMDDPTRDGKSIDHASRFVSGMDVHHSSGVFNKAFYLLSNKSGWGIKKTFEVFVRANQNIWSPNETYVSAAEDVYDVACTLGYNTADVSSAFSAVGVTVKTTCKGPGTNVADLKVTLKPDPVSKGEVYNDPALGNAIRYSATVFNRGALSAVNVVLKNTLPSEVAIGTIKPTSGSCDSKAVCTLGNLPAGSSSVVDIIVTTASKNKMQFAADGSSNTKDDDLSDNTATITLGGGSLGWGFMMMLGAVASLRRRRTK